MKRFKYFRLWLLLLLALAVVTAVSFYEEIRIGDHVLKKAPIADNLLRDPLEKEKEKLEMMEKERLASEAQADTLPGAGEEPKVVETDSASQSIFIFGDSMTFNLALRLAQYARHNGHSIHAVNWDSSNTKVWADHDTLSYFMNLYKPTQIFVSLGSNEMYFKDPETRAPYIRKILEVIDTVPYVWIGPPNWKEDTGINNLLARLCRPGSFFRSEGMEFKRKKDRIHPTRQSSALWVDSIMRWLPRSSHPFVAALPPDTIGKVNPHIVFLKALNK